MPLLLMLLLSLATCFIIPGNISAEETPQDNKEDNTEIKTATIPQSPEVKPVTLGSKTDDRPSLVATARNAGLFLIGAGLISFLLQRKKNLFLPNKKTENKLQIIEQLSLGNGTALIVVEAFGHNILLSKNQGKVEFLTKLSEGINIDERTSSSKEQNQDRLETLSERVQSIRVATQNAN